MNYITVQELCDNLKVTRQCIYEWRKKGMPCYKIGRMVRLNFPEEKA